jgi:hypothetical protein
MMHAFQKYRWSGIAGRLLAIAILLFAGIADAEHAEMSIYALIDGKLTAVEHEAIFARQEQKVEIRFSNQSNSHIGWFLLKPQPLDYNNVTYCKYEKGCVQPIEYFAEELLPLRGKTQIDVSQIPELAAPGTHELVMRTERSEKQFQVVIRRDDSYVGYATELLGVPFVYAPRYQAGGHQADLRKGADCIALIIYARRRQGYSIPYFAPPKLYNYTDKVGDKRTISKTRIQAGDILHFGFQTAIVAEHRSTKDGLDDNDLIIHTYHGVAEITTFSRLAYRSENYDILRWRANQGAW